MTLSAACLVQCRAFKVSAATALCAHQSNTLCRMGLHVTTSNVVQAHKLPSSLQDGMQKQGIQCLDSQPLARAVADVQLAQEAVGPHGCRQAEPLHLPVMRQGAVIMGHLITGPVGFGLQY